MYKRIDKIENGVIVHGNDSSEEETPRTYYENLNDALADILGEVRETWKEKESYVEIRWG